MSKDVNDKPAWESAFIKPIAKVMKDRGIGYLLITLRDDGKAAYVMEPLDDGPPNNRPEDGRVCQCEDAPCCGCYSLR